MNDNAPNPDLSFLETESAVNFHIKDLLYVLLRNLHWLILFGALGAFIANFSARRQDRIYISSAKIVLRGNSNSGGVSGGGDNSMREASVNSMLTSQPFYNSSINNEMMILTSKTTMLKTVENIGLNTSYISNSKLVHRKKDLYGCSPIKVSFLDISEDDYVACNVTPLPKKKVKIEYGEFAPLIADIGDTVAAPFGRVVVAPTLFSIGEYINTPITVAHVSATAVAEGYRRAISIVRDDDKNTIVNISLTDKSPSRAADVINELIRVYNDQAIQDKKRIIVYTYDYINDRLAQLYSDLDEQEEAIANFKRDNQLLDVSSYGQAYMSTNAEYTAAIEQMQKQLSLCRYVHKLCQDSTSYNVIPLSIGIDEPHIESAIAQYNELTLRLEKNRNLRNPVTRKTHEAQEQSRNSLSLLLSVYSDALEQRIADAHGVVAKTKEQISQVPAHQIYIDNVERLQHTKEELYLSLLSKREELLISQPSIEGNAKIIDEARVNPSPIAPKVARDTLVGLLLGILAPIIVFLLRRALDTKVRYQGDVKERTSMPFLCEIPARKKQDIRDIVITDGQLDTMAEAFRLLRSKLEFFGHSVERGQDAMGRVFMITSMLPASGKTFVSSNTAASFALAQKKTIIIDLDLRKGSLTRRFYSRRHGGISEYLAKKTNDIESIIRHDTVALGLDAIFSGAIPPNPTELIGNGRIEVLLDYLRRHYEYIILDCAPMSVVDNTMMQDLIDGCVFVVRSKKYDKRLVNDMDEIYQAKTFPGMSVVLNDVSYQKKSPVDKIFGLEYGYGRKYGYTYRNYAYQEYGYYEYSDKEAES